MKKWLIVLGLLAFSNQANAQTIEWSEWWEDRDEMCSEIAARIYVGASGSLNKEYSAEDKNFYRQAAAEYATIFPVLCGEVKWKEMKDE